MQAVVVEEKSRKAWDDYVAMNAYAIAWQSYGWSDVVSKHYNLRFYPIAVFEGTRIRGILPLYHVKVLSGKGSLISVPYAVAGGLLADNLEVQDLLLNKAIELSHELGGLRICLKQYKIKVEADLQSDMNYYNAELSLHGSSEELWNRISEFNRSKIDEALRQGAVLEYCSNDIDFFYKLLLRHTTSRGVPCVSKEWIKDLLAFQMYSLALLRINGEIVAGTMVKEFKDTISFPFTCLAQGATALPAYALYWKLISHFAAEGKAIFHSGRIPNNDKTDDYRLGWGGTKHQYYYQYYPATEMKTEYQNKRGKKREIIEECWKRLPLGVAAYLGPRVVKYFP